MRSGYERSYPVLHKTHFHIGTSVHLNNHKDSSGSEMQTAQSHPIAMESVPKILRIKRKRGQDPLQALILEGHSLAKRSKTSSPGLTSNSKQQEDAKSWYFELSSTDAKETNISGVENGLMLSETATLLKKRQFVIPKQESAEAAELPQQLHQMLDDFLTLEEEVPARIKKRRGSSIKPAEDASLDRLRSDNDEYVFDVYKLTSNEPITNMNYPQSQIGYIRFFDDEESELVNVDESRDPRADIYSDDEDSNAESFYQNDYPEDEDAGEFSETYEQFNEDSDDDSDYLYGGGEYSSQMEPSDVRSHFKSYTKSNLGANGEYDNLFDGYFDEYGNPKKNILDEEDY